VKWKTSAATKNAVSSKIKKRSRHSKTLDEDEKTKDLAPTEVIQDLTAGSMQEGLKGQR